MKIAHFLSDNKFVDKHIDKFINRNFNNEFYYFKKVNNYTGRYKDKVIYLSPESVEYFKIIKGIDNFDIVILYYLNTDKFKLIEAIKYSKVKIIWSFYGAELYSLPNIRLKMLSENTQLVLKDELSKSNLESIKDVFKWLLSPFRNKRTKLQWIKKSCKRIDYFLWYNEFEYELLNKYMGQILPTFMEAPLNNALDEVEPDPNKENSLLIGNSASYYNNHLDALDILATNRYKGKVSLPFSYLKNDHYVALIEKYAVRSGLAFKIIDEFMTYAEYIEFINWHKAAVYPSYRQMGLGNIFIAIRCGLKIYLSDKNPTLKWLREMGMKIYSMEQDLSNDLIKNNLTLEPAHVALNNNIYTSMVSAEQDKLLFNQFRNIIK